VQSDSASNNSSKLSSDSNDGSPSDSRAKWEQSLIARSDFRSHGAPAAENPDRIAELVDGRCSAAGSPQGVTSDGMHAEFGSPDSEQLSSDATEEDAFDEPAKKEIIDLTLDDSDDDCDVDLQLSEVIPATNGADSVSQSDDSQVCGVSNKQAPLHMRPVDLFHESQSQSVDSLDSA
jgi:hypothetical protein